MANLQKRILLGHLGARGDCLYATAVARQIKADYPRCHLTWAVGSMCRTILDGNPYVDEIWEVAMASHDEMASAWEKFHWEALKRKQAGDFDEAFFTQIYPDNFGNFDGTVRASVFRGYPKPITVPITPVIRLTPLEVENVRSFAETHGLGGKSRVILFEFASGSGQTFINPEFSRKAAEGIVARVQDCKVILASHLPVDSTDPRIIDGSVLSFRENAELTKYCSLLIGCSSGITWLCTSEWAKQLPTIQLLSRRTSVYASLVHDHAYFGLATYSIIEMTDCQVDHLVGCVNAVFQDGFDKAREVYHERIPIRFDFYARTLKYVIGRKRYRQAIMSVLNVVRRYGLHPALVYTVTKLIFSTLWVSVSRLLGAAYRQLSSPRTRKNG